MEPLVPGGAGHGCGHNLLGTAGLGAALAIKELIASGELAGTVRFYGTPAEETVGGKLYMLRAGLFDDLDAVLAWHPSLEIVADTKGNQAVVDFAVEFEGRTAHAAYDPWNGRSAADGAEVFTFALNLMREHIRPTARIHYVVTDAGDVPNVVPAYARVWCWMRDASHAGVDEMLERAKTIAEGAALATGTTVPPHRAVGRLGAAAQLAGATLIHDNMTWLGPIEFTDEEQEFARQIQRATDAEPVGLKGVPKPLDLDPAGCRRRLDRCRRCQLAGADPPLFGDHGADRRALARLARGRRRRHVHRPQGHGLRRQDHGRDHGRSLRRPGEARRGPPRSSRRRPAASSTSAISSDDPPPLPAD